MQLGFVISRANSYKAFDIPEIYFITQNQKSSIFCKCNFPLHSFNTEIKMQNVHQRASLQE